RAGAAFRTRSGTRPGSSRPGEQRRQALALSLLAFDQLGEGQRLAAQPSAFDLAGLAVNRFPDKADCFLIAFNGLVGELLGFPFTGSGSAEAEDQCCGGSQDLALVVVAQQLVSFHVVVNRGRLFLVLFHLAKALFGFLPTFLPEPAHLAHMSLRRHRVVSQAPDQLLRAGMVAISGAVRAAVVAKLLAEL